MEEIVRVKKINHSFMQLECSASTAMELSEYFSFESPGARFSPLVKNKLWDGKIKLFSLATHQMYNGLYIKLHQFCKARDYIIEKVPSEYGKPLDITEHFTIEVADNFAKALKLHAFGEDIRPHDFQLDAFYRAIKYQRKIFHSPTGSGKSLIIYLIIRFMLAWKPNRKILLVVPTTNLVEQMYSDFADYSTNNKWDISKYCAKIYAGHTKYPEHPVTISTWQSLYQLPTEYFDKFYTVIGDEAHQYKAKSLIGIMSKCKEARFRIGTTGTTDKIETNTMVLEGLFGGTTEIATTKDLQSRGILSPLKIKCVVLGYNEAERKEVRKMLYQEEISFLIGHPERNRFIANLCIAQTANVLCLYARVAKHGQILYEMIKEKVGDTRKVFFVFQKTTAMEREQIRGILEHERNAILIASYGTFSTGNNMRNLHSIVFGSPNKGRIRNLQSIGRGLRPYKGSGTTAFKSECVLFDISDDLSVGEHQNFSLKHMIERLEIYDSEAFDYKITQLPLR